MMATYLLIKTRADFPQVFMARTRADLFMVISQAFTKKAEDFSCDTTRAILISELASVPDESWQPGLHLISLVGSEWMLIIAEGESAFGMA